jgi:hypothetical protein
MIKMSKFNFLVLMLTLFLWLPVHAQTIITKISKLKIDEKEVKKDYKDLLYSKNKSVEAKRTTNGFIVPDELRSEEYLDVTITFGKHKLDFSEIHISNFDTVWIVGVDKKPFSNVNSYLVERKTTKSINYIVFILVQV